ncbi:hypothetical protein HDU91_006742 [Kappamyces sp. JEL0680]|nr:hypothetical protein HDU91_006742 [Kappamyces sp. JEL0680]
MALNSLGYLLDVKVLEDCVKSNLGDITFEEAFHKTKRILNITVTSTRTNEVPSVLNHLTSPNVLIRSAATASASMIGLYSSVDLLAKDSNGRIFVWSPSLIKWGPSKGDNTESPEQRLAELFNVNHYVLSQSQPYIAPFLSRGRDANSKRSILSRLFTFTGSEIRFRITQLARLGLVPNFISSVFDQRIKGHVTISPPLSSMDFYTIFGNPTFQSLSYWILKGQQSTWPFLSIIKNRTMIEKKLHQAKTEALDLLNSRRKVELDSKTRLKKRTQSISLDDDFVVEKIDASSDEENFNSETVDGAVVEWEDSDEPSAVPSPADKKPAKPKKEFVGNSKRQKLHFEDLGIDLQDLPSGLHERTWTALIDKLYESAPKPLYVKSHTKIKVLIVCSNALRCLEIIKELRASMPKIMVAKLFARHLKVSEQIELLKKTPFLVGVGTAARISKIIETDEEAIKVNKLEYLLIDGTWKDKKNQTIVDVPEVNMDLKRLVETLRDSVIGTLSL